jgi:hypothetical protein
VAARIGSFVELLVYGFTQIASLAGKKHRKKKDYCRLKRR